LEKRSVQRQNLLGGAQAQKTNIEKYSFFMYVRATFKKIEITFFYSYTMQGKNERISGNNHSKLVEAYV
jgi:hypothetical protein